MSTLPLTQLSEDESLFRTTVLAFARERIGPRVHSMDQAAAVDKALIPELFQLGIMGIEIPEAYGGAGADMFSAILAIEAIAQVDPSISVLLDVQNTLVHEDRDARSSWMCRTRSSSTRC